MSVASGNSVVKGNSIIRGKSVWDDSGQVVEFARTLRYEFAGSTSLKQAAYNGPVPVLTRPSTATYFDATGTRQTAASGEARFDHDPDTGEALGLLIEPQRTNSLLNASSPATQTVSGVPASARTLWMESSGSVDGSGATDGAYGTATEGSPLTFTPSVTQDVTATVNGSVDVFQLEDGSFKTSFIPTTSSAVTRSEDVLGPTALADLGYSGGPCTVVVRHAIDVGTLTLSSAHLLRLDDGGGDVPDNSVILSLTGGGGQDLQVRENGGPAITNTGQILSLDGNRHAVAFAIGPGGVTVHEDGAQVYSDTTDYSTVLGNVANLRIGYNVSGHYRQVLFFNSALSAAELARLTA